MPDETAEERTEETADDAAELLGIEEPCALERWDEFCDEEMREDATDEHWDKFALDTALVALLLLQESVPWQVAVHAMGKLGEVDPTHTPLGCS
jgi:hypothetical protein